MFELTAANALSYLEARGESISPDCLVRSLGGGVSNTVLLVEWSERRLVLKQSLPKLRVEEDWFADRSRIFRESKAMRMLASHLPGAVPSILFEDSTNYLYAMTAAPAEARTWKALLLDGAFDHAVARRIAEMMTAMVRASWKSAAWERIFGDQTAFDQLRLDPYYRFTATRHPDLAPCFQERIHDAQTRCVALVHGDWSPKNFLVSGDAVVAIDFEVIHYGDPAFDSAFLLNHLLLKSFHRPHWASAYTGLARTFFETLLDGMPGGQDWFEPATCRHLGCLLAARIDGKSPAEYIRDEQARRRIREFARWIILEGPERVDEIFERVQSCQ